MKQMVLFNESSLGVVFDPEMPIQELINYGFTVASETVDLHRGLNARIWRIGDWYNECKRRIEAEPSYMNAAVLNGDFSRGVKNLGHQRDSIYNIASLCASVPISLRNEILTPSHHLVVRSLPPDKITKYLSFAAKQQPVMTVREFRVFVKSNEGVEDDPGDKRENAVSGPYGWAASLNMWFGGQDIDDWDEEKLEVWELELAPIVELYNRIKKRRSGV